jgi:hypothetical protein
MATESIGAMMQLLVPEVARLVKNPALFERIWLYRDFVREAVFCLESLQWAASALDATEAATTYLVDHTRLHNNWNCRLMYGFSEDNFIRPRDYLLLNKPLLFYNSSTMQPHTVTVHELMSGGVRLAYLWELHARVAHTQLAQAMCSHLWLWLTVIRYTRC